MNGPAIEQIEPGALSPEELSQFTDVFNSGQLEASPRSSPFDPETLVGYLSMPHAIREQFVTRNESGQIIGHLMTSRDSDGGNAHTLRLMVWVDPDHRREGIGRSLTAFAAKKAIDDGRVFLQGEAWDTVPAGIAFVERLGSEMQIENHANFVEISDLDRDMLAVWQSEGPGRAPDYDLEVAEDGFPDEYLDGVARMLLMLEQDAPMPEGREPRQWTGEMVREMATHNAGMVETLTSVAIHRESRGVVGLSQLLRPFGAPRTMITTWTVVDREHRGHALGKWLKSAVILRGLERWPDAEDIETMNAFSNDAMLGINHEIGFVHDFTVRTYQVEAARVLDLLS